MQKYFKRRVEMKHANLEIQKNLVHAEFYSAKIPLFNCEQLLAVAILGMAFLFFHVLENLNCIALKIEMSV